MDSKDIRDLNKIYMEAVYGGAKKVEKKDTRLTVTAADKKANTKAYQNYKAGNKAYKAADHLGEGKAESPEAEEEKDKKDDNLAGAPNKKGKKKAKRWWDDDGDGKGYEKGEVKEGYAKPNTTVPRGSKVGPKKVAAPKGSKTNVANKEITDLQKAAQTLKGKNVAKADALLDEYLPEKESYKTVAAVIDYDRSKKGTDDAVYDTEHGKKKAAKKERDYAAWERSKMRRDDPNWEHKKGSTSEEFDELDNELLQLAEDTLEKFSSDEILNMMESSVEMYESGWHRRNPGKKHPLESGSTKTQRRPVSDQEKKSTDKEDRMYVAMRRVTDRQKGYNADKSKAAGRLHDRYTTRQAKRKAGASPKEASAQSFGEFGGKDFAIKRGGRKGKAPATDRGTGNKAARRAGQEVKNRDPRK